MAEEKSFDRLYKAGVRALADAVQEGSEDSIRLAVEFFVAETRGYWHNRGRAMIARRLKHVPLRGEQRTEIVRAIVRRLETGYFTEQFMDQLRLARHLDPLEVRRAAERCLQSPHEHVRRYAGRVLAGDGPDAS